MRTAVYRYDFGPDVPLDEVEASILLALIGTESLHGECEVQLASPHYLDRDRRACIVDATTPLGNDFNRLLLGLLRREFGPTAFTVRVVDSAHATAPTAA